MSDVDRFVLVLGLLIGWLIPAFCGVVVGLTLALFGAPWWWALAPVVLGGLLGVWLASWLTRTS